MSLPLWLLLIPFALLLLVWLVFSIVAITKMLRFGFLSRPAVISSFAYILFAVVILLTTITGLSAVDWSTSLEIGTPDIALPALPDLKGVTNTFQP
ncbi:MAG: hypothetical protein AAB515_02680 [Patescibacteria group bacterium]